MKVGEFRVKFVKVYEWFARCDKLKINLNQGKKDYQIILYFKNN